MEYYASKLGSYAIGILLACAVWVGLKWIINYFKNSKSKVAIGGTPIEDFETVEIQNANNIKINSAKLMILENKQLLDLILAIPDIINRRDNKERRSSFDVEGHNTDGNLISVFYKKPSGSITSILTIDYKEEIQFKFVILHKTTHNVISDIFITNDLYIDGPALTPIYYSDIQLYTIINYLFDIDHKAYINDKGIYNNVLDLIGSALPVPYSVNLEYDYFTRFVFLNYRHLKECNINLCILGCLGIPLNEHIKILECPTFLVVNGGRITISFFKGLPNECNINVNNTNYAGYISDNVNITKSVIPETLKDIHPLFIIHAFERATAILEEYISATKIHYI